ncbi:hypothetical protein [Spirilliplanes yamanashiensis]|uniref:Copper resistance protein D domain-containing protein n=1 Tax=Spirilliplanes yamanashiensis TaxID=42233 RepID=A0A8J3YEV5_9ACTN|nr:hypothetical protein [Spirilliplanes yamanashiensis]MDP9818446.1 hypothetical protein [Spirilliplanes yamanashiensis]GIJ06430.1 hypothetical protein Sya03_57820 [Spirilliplanes yamanashiensis]
MILASSSFTSAIPVITYAQLAGLALVVGAVLTSALLGSAPRRGRTAAWLAHLGIVLLAAGTAAQLWRHTAAPEPGSDGYGALLTLRLAVLCVAAWLLRPLFNRPPDQVRRPDYALLTVLAVAGTATWPLTAHAARTPSDVATAALDVAQVVATAAWAGTVACASWALRRGPGPDTVKVLERWARGVTIVLVVVLATSTLRTLAAVAGDASAAVQAFSSGQWLVAALLLIFTLRGRHLLLGAAAARYPAVRRALWHHVIAGAVLLGLSVAVVQAYRDAAAPLT